MNLSYLQRLDAGVESIVATAGHVALYDFDPRTKAWSRKDVEGSLFLVRRRDGRFRFVILNKKGDSGDYWEDVGPGFSCEKQEPYVMYKRATSVVGIWFYEARDCGRFAALFEDIGGGGGGQGGVGGGQGVGQGGVHGGQVLLGMLQAQGDNDDAQRVRALLEGLSRNEAFCRMLGEEMRRAGW